jgi:hypothetical protein
MMLRLTRYPFALLGLALAACSSGNDMTRTFGTSRDAPPDIVATSRMPLSAPPALSVRPTQPDVLGSAQRTRPTRDQASVGAGQDAFLQASGPAAPPGVRREIDASSGLAYPPRAFVERLMTWTPGPGYTPVFDQASQGGWFSWLF